MNVVSIENFRMQWCQIYFGDLGAVLAPVGLAVEEGFVETVDGRLVVVLIACLVSVGLPEDWLLAATVPFCFTAGCLTELGFDAGPFLEVLSKPEFPCEVSAERLGIGLAGGGRASPPDTAFASLGSVGLIVAGLSSTAETTLSGFVPAISFDANAEFFVPMNEVFIKSPMALSLRGFIAGEAVGVASMADSGIISATLLCFRSSFSCDTVFFNSAILSES